MLISQKCTVKQKLTHNIDKVNGIRTGFNVKMPQIPIACRRRKADLVILWLVGNFGAELLQELGEVDAVVGTAAPVFGAGVFLWIIKSVYSRISRYQKQK